MSLASVGFGLFAPPIFLSFDSSPTYSRAFLSAGCASFVPLLGYEGGRKGHVLFFFFGVKDKEYDAGSGSVFQGKSQGPERARQKGGLDFGDIQPLMLV